MGYYSSNGSLTGKLMINIDELMDLEVPYF